MGRLRMPDLPPGPHRDLVEALHGLHHRAGLPSLRDLAREVGASRTTVAAAFSTPRIPRWGLVELVVEALGGDVAAYHERWLLASGAPAPIPATSGNVSSPQAQREVPRQIPAGTRPFVGRAEQLRLLDRLLTTDDAAGVPWAVVSGPPGAGKSALVCSWWESARDPDRFPDGELFVDLCGHDMRQAVTPKHALAELLRAVGVADRDLPGSRSERAALWRTKTTKVRLLVVLDDARDSEQVADLFPAPGGCRLVVTSRDHMPALRARYGGVRVDVGGLPHDEACRLLGTVIGERADAERASVSALVERCAALPLALRLAAERVATRPTRTLADLVDELAEPHALLDLLELDDPSAGAATRIFSWSVGQLGERQQRAFALLGAVPGLDLDADLAAALWACDARTARMDLEWLRRLHLVESKDDATVIHDLVRAYAAGLLERDAASGAARAAVARLGARVGERIERDLGSDLPGAESISSTAVIGEDADDAFDRRWSLRRGEVLAVARLAVEHRVIEVAALSRLLAQPLDARGYYEDALAIHEAALDVAAAHGDEPATVAAALRVGLVHRRRGDYARAEEVLRPALERSQRLDDPAGEAAVLVSLGAMGWRQGRYREARDLLERARTRSMAAGDRRSEGATLYHLGIVSRRLGDYRAAAAYHVAAMTLAHSLGDHVGEGRAMNNAGVVQLRLGHLDEAERLFRAALAIQRAHHDVAGEAVLRTNLAWLLECRGELEPALAELDRAAALVAAAGYRVGEGDVARGRGRVLIALGRTDAGTAALGSAAEWGARVGEADTLVGSLNDLAAALLDKNDPTGLEQVADLLARAREAAGRSGDPAEAARVEEATGRWHVLAGDVDIGRERLTSARDTFRRLGLPDASRVERWLGP